MASLKTHLSLARLSNAPTVLSNVLAGLSLAGIVSLDRMSGWLMLSMVFFYTAGMYLNDYFDAGFDAENQKFRPIPSGAISKSQVGIFGFSIMLLANIILAFTYPRLLLAGLGLSSLILAYDFLHKGRPWTVVIMAATRVMVYMIASWVVYWHHSALLPALGLGSYIIGLSLIARSDVQEKAGRILGILFLLVPALIPIAELYDTQGLYWSMPRIG